MSRIVLKRFGDLVEGDKIVGSDGEITEVAKAYDVHVPETMYEVGSGNKSIRVSGNHLWYIETDLDRATHKKRVREASKILKNLDEDSWGRLTEIVEMEAPEIKTTLSDMIGFCDADNNSIIYQILSRIALSLGPIEEENVIQADVETDKVLSKNTERVYDARKFIQQIKALAGNKPKEVIVGQVVSTERMLVLLPLGVNIPDLPSKD